MTLGRSLPHEHDTFHVDNMRVARTTLTVLASETIACSQPVRCARHTASSILWKTGRRVMLHLISVSVTWVEGKYQQRRSRLDSLAVPVSPLQGWPPPIRPHLRVNGQTHDSAAMSELITNYSNIRSFRLLSSSQRHGDKSRLI